MKKNIKIVNKNKIDKYVKKKQITLRTKVNELYFKYNLSKNKIYKKERVSKKFVIKWTQSPSQDFFKDDRGWKKGKRRKIKDQAIERIKEIHKYLNEDNQSYFDGATAINQEWKRRYKDEDPLALRTVGMILKELGLSHTRRIKRRGAASYLCYPEYTIYTLLGGRVLEADFIGKKYITGKSEPVNFIGFAFKKEPRLRYYKRIESQTSDCLIEGCEQFIQRFEKPNYIKVDNCLAAIGSASGKRNISNTMKYLLSKEIIPIFSVPRKPFTQASIEGNNSVFSRFFWNKTRFTNLEEIDEQLEWFNKSSLRYTGYESLEQTYQLKRKDFIPKIYFIRQVKEQSEPKSFTYIDILNEKIRLSKDYINYYVLAEWNLHHQQLSVYFEKEKKQLLIKDCKFEINKNSLNKLNLF